MADTAGDSDYRSFVLRLWWDAGAGGLWRCSLEDPATRQRRGFEDLDALAAYLRDALPPTPRAATRARRPAP